MSQVNFIDVAGSNPEIVTNIIADIGDAIAINNTIELLGGTDIQTVASGNTITINFTGTTGLHWNTITSADNVKQILVNNSYITAGVSQCILLLPLTANVGDPFVVTAYTSTFQITQNANQSIIFGFQQSTSGVTGSITSTGFGDHVSVVCIVANLVFKIIDSMGNLTVV